MTLVKALKVKKRLAGEIANLQEIFKRENSRRNDNPSTVDPSAIYKQIQAKLADLISVKTAIAKANVDIYAKIEEMTELKQYINFVRGVPIRRGEEVVFQGMQREKLTYQWTAFLTQEDIDAEVVKTQEKINLLQDEIDEYNARTVV